MKPSSGTEVPLPSCEPTLAWSLMSPSSCYHGKPEAKAPLGLTTPLSSPLVSSLHGITKVVLVKCP